MKSCSSQDKTTAATSDAKIKSSLLYFVTGEDIFETLFETVPKVFKKPGFGSMPTGTSNASIGATKEMTPRVDKDLIQIGAYKV